jgi:hypothetical protein
MGAPYGLAIAVHAVAGPSDLGTVVVRQALNVDPDDVHAVVTSDPSPTIRDGVSFRRRPELLQRRRNVGGLAALEVIVVWIAFGEQDGARRVRW